MAIASISIRAPRGKSDICTVERAGDYNQDARWWDGKSRAKTRSGTCFQRAGKVNVRVLFAGIAQVLRQLICNPQVLGSNPSAGSIDKAFVSSYLFQNPRELVAGSTVSQSCGDSDS